MKIEIKRPNPDYPLVYVHIPVTHNEVDVDVDVILSRSRITLLGKWEPDDEGNYKAPALLEDEHVKPKKKPGPRTKK